MDGVHAACGMPDRRGRELVRGEQGFSSVGAGRVGLRGARHVYWTRWARLEVRGGRWPWWGGMMEWHGNATAGMVEREERERQGQCCGMCWDVGKQCEEPELGQTLF